MNPAAAPPTIAPNGISGTEDDPETGGAGVVVLSRTTGVESVFSITRVPLGSPFWFKLTFNMD